MINIFRSTQIDPFARGREFGVAHAQKIKRNIDIYQSMFARLGGTLASNLKAGHECLMVTAAFAPPLHQEMIGMAEGAGVDAAFIGMLNARTEILAMLKAKTKGECSAITYTPAHGLPPIAIQTWDWFYGLRDGWLVWEIPLADGSMTKTMTEYGIVGKTGLNTRGLGLLFTILHHTSDGQKIGVPVHVAARWVLDSAPNIARAAQMLAAADVSASSSINLVSHEDGVGAAITVELFPGGPGFVLPDHKGFTVHTNHFLASDAMTHDSEPKLNPDTLLRRAYLQRELHALENISAVRILDVMANHSGSEGAVCCHHDPQADPAEQYETLATIVLDVKAGEMQVTRGGPCGRPHSP
jgi:isopenicillin-N N-acyltransferase like protein